MARTQSNRGGSSRGRGGASNDGSFIGALKDRPYTTAAAAAGVAAASAFLWSKRGQIGEAIESGRDRFAGDRPQDEISEEALTLKETGKKTKGARGPIAQQDIKAGVATSNQEAKAGAKAFS